MHQLEWTALKFLIPAAILAGHGEAASMPENFRGGIEENIAERP
jgi:hypothetical protein